MAYAKTAAPCSSCVRYSCIERVFERKGGFGAREGGSRPKMEDRTQRRLELTTALGIVRFECLRFERYFRTGGRSVRKHSFIVAGKTVIARQQSFSFVRSSSCLKGHFKLRHQGRSNHRGAIRQDLDWNGWLRINGYALGYFFPQHRLQAAFRFQTRHRRRK